MEKVKEYKNKDVTVVWKPGLCIHSAKCVHGMPDVFKPKDKPWIQAENAAAGELKATIDKCPSGALSYYSNSDGPKEEKAMSEVQKVEVIDGGPVIVMGTCEIKHADGSVEIKKRSAAFCRCGKTGNSPFCDGSHNA